MPEKKIQAIPVLGSALHFHAVFGTRETTLAKHRQEKRLHNVCSVDELYVSRAKRSLWRSRAAGELGIERLVSARKRACSIASEDKRKPRGRRERGINGDMAVHLITVKRSSFKSYAHRCSASLLGLLAKIKV